MFVRRQVKKSGSISISVVDKSRGRYEVVRTFGTVKTAAEADLLENRAREFVREQTGEPEPLFARMSEPQLRAYAATLDQGRIELAGPELLFGFLFDRLHLGEGRESLFRHLVMARLADPGSKLRVTGYLQRYLGKPCEPEVIYRLVDGMYLTDMCVSPTVPVACQMFPSPVARMPFCLLTDADGLPVAGRLLDRKAVSGARGEKALQRLARKYGATEPVAILKGSEVCKAWPVAFRMSPKDLSFKPMLRRKKGRVEGHLCICLAASAVQAEWERLLAGSDITFSQVREAAGTMFRLNYVSPYTHRPKSVLLPMDPVQKKVFDLVHAD